VDTSDIQGLLERAADAVTPLLDKLYEKAFQSHQSVFDPTVTKYDLSFRLKNTQRLLTLVIQLAPHVMGINYYCLREYLHIIYTKVFTLFYPLPCI